MKGSSSKPFFSVRYFFLCLLIVANAFHRWHGASAFYVPLPLVTPQQSARSLSPSLHTGLKVRAKPRLYVSSTASNENSEASAALDHPIILFDGVCNFCNAWVDVLLRIDRQGIYRFTPLQSPLGQRLLMSIGKEKDDISSVLLIEADGKTYYAKSECVLQVIRQLGPLAALASRSITFLLPESVRNAIYDMVAENRYNFLGERNTCRSGDPIYFDRFVS